MTAEAVRKNLILEYAKRMTAGDVDAVLALFAENVTFEDPVGSGASTGRARLRAHLETAIANKVREIPGAPVATQDGRHALCPVTVRMNYLPAGEALARHGVVEPPENPDERLLGLNVVMVIRADANGLIEDIRAHWGLSDISIV
jgi:steroid delta-isomerase